MDSSEQDGSQPRVLSSRLWSLFSLDWVPLIFEIYRGIRQLVKDSHQGLYEMLEYDSTLELLDTKGEVAIFKKHQKVRFLQDNVIAFQDHVWGDGEVFADYKCSPGREVDRYQDGNRWNVLISLRKTKSAGDIEDFYIERKIVGGLANSEEWWQIEMQNETKWLKFSVIFPKGRHCQEASLCEKTKNRTNELDSGHFTDLPDGKQVLLWENKKPERFEMYTIKWRW